MCNSRLRDMKTYLWDGCIRAKSWAIEKSESEPVLYIRGIVSGAAKAALGVNYIVDLGLSTIPQTSVFYNGFKIVKYVATGAVFIAASVSAYGRSKKEINTREIIKQMEEKLAEVDRMVLAVDNILKSQKELYKKANYPAETLSDVVIDIAVDSLAVPLKKSKFSTLFNSKPSLYICSAIDGTIKAAGADYIFNLTSNYLPATNVFSFFEKTAVISTFLGATYQSHMQSNTVLMLREKIKMLEIKMAAAHKKLGIIEKLLGSKEELIKIAEEGARLTDEVLWFENTTKDSRALKWELNKISESKPILYFRSLIDGAVNASGVHYTLETLFPSEPAIKYIGALSILAGKTYRSFKQRESNIKTQVKIVYLKENMANKMVLLDVAEKIKRQQISLINTVLAPSDALFLSSELQVETDDISDELLMADFEQLNNMSPLSDEFKEEKPKQNLVELSDLSRSTSSVVRSGLFNKTINPRLVELGQPLLGGGEEWRKESYIP